MARVVPERSFKKMTRRLSVGAIGHTRHFKPMSHGPLRRSNSAAEYNHPGSIYDMRTLREERGGELKSAELHSLSFQKRSSTGSVSSLSSTGDDLNTFTQARNERKLNRHLSLHLKKNLAEYEKDLPEEIATIRDNPWFIILPSNMYKMVFDCFIFLFTIHAAVVVPMEVGFESKSWNDLWYRRFSLLVDIAFMIDFVLGYVTGFVGDDGEIVSSLLSILKRNVCSYFFPLDLAASIPWSLVGGDTAGFAVVRILKFGKVSKILAMFRIVRILKFRKMYSYVSDMFQLYHQLADIVTTFFFVTLMVHLNACFFSFTAEIADDDGTTDTWLDDRGLANATVGKRYLDSVYWSITTITTVGFGDVVPSSDAEKAYCIFAVAIGAVIYGTVISTFVASAAARNMRRNMLNERLDGVVAYMKYKNFPDKLFKKVFKYFHHYYDIKTSFDEAQILRELNERLRIEVSSYLAYSTFREVRLFRKYHVRFLTVILLATKPVRVQEGDVVFECGKVGNEMYIVTVGTLRSIYKGSEKADRTLSVHDTFGEMCTLGLAERRQETVYAESMVDLLCLTKFDLFRTLGESAPHVLTDMRQRVVRKYKRLHRDKDRRLSFTPPVVELMANYDRKKKEKRQSKDGKMPKDDNRRDSFGNLETEAAELHRKFANLSSSSNNATTGTNQDNNIGFIPTLTRGTSAATSEDPSRASRSRLGSVGSVLSFVSRADSDANLAKDGGSVAGVVAPTRRISAHEMANRMILEGSGDSPTNEEYISLGEYSRSNSVVSSGAATPRSYIPQQHRGSFEERFGREPIGDLMKPSLRSPAFDNARLNSHGSIESTGSVAERLLAIERIMEDQAKYLRDRVSQENSEIKKIQESLGELHKAFRGLKGGRETAVALSGDR